MHPRNPYITPPNFADLAEAVPALKPLWAFVTKDVIGKTDTP